MGSRRIGCHGPQALACQPWFADLGADNRGPRRLKLPESMRAARKHWQGGRKGLWEAVDHGKLVTSQGRLRDGQATGHRSLCRVSWCSNVVLHGDREHRGIGRNRGRQMGGFSRMGEARESLHRGADS